VVFQPDTQDGGQSEDGDSRLGPSSKSTSPIESSSDITSIKNREIFGVVYRGNDGWRSRLWHQMVNRQAQSNNAVSPIYNQKAVRPGTDDSLLLKSQLEEISQSGGGQTGSSNSGGISSFYVGKVSSDAILFSHIVQRGLFVERLIVKAGTPPASDFTMDVNAGGKQRSRTLSASDSKAVFPINASISEEEELRVTAPSTADGSIADVRCSFRVIAT